MESYGGPAAAVPYIGSKISLISNADIRYEGTLHFINTLASTVCLSNVFCHGTEGRRSPDVPLGSKTYEYIIFKGKDIKDLTVCEPPLGIGDDPAILTINTTAPTSAPPAHMPSMQSTNQHTPAYPDKMSMMDVGGMMDMGNHQMRGSRPVMGGREQQMDMNAYNVQRGYPNYMSPPPHMGQVMQTPGRPPYGAMGYGRGGDRMNKIPMVPMNGEDGRMFTNMSRGGRGGRGDMRKENRQVVGELPPQLNAAFKLEVSSLFDFETSNARFDKTLAGKETGESNTIPTEIGQENGDKKENVKDGITISCVGYDKKTSFFDSISCETLNPPTLRDREHQRKVDFETFGVEASRRTPYRRGVRRRAGRQMQQSRYVPINMSRDDNARMHHYNTRF